MLKSCSKCGRIHEHNYICKGVNVKHNSDTLSNKFRRSRKWRTKRNNVLIRDKGLCQLCIRKMYDTFGQIYNNPRIEVHHIDPIVEEYELRLEDSNLISLCVYHHKRADRGEIPRDILRSIVNES